MKIERITAHAFGPFSGQRLDLAPGMTVVSGPNEAGKSSWHAAIRLAITGVRRGRGRTTAADVALSERHRPWDATDRWEVEARLTLDDGRTVDVQQDLAGKVACRAVEVGLGRDVSDEILDGTPDASRWLGLDRDAFAATVSVSQAQVMAVADAAGDLQEQMQRAAATRGTDATAAEAIDRLAEFRREAVGADTVAAKGPLRAARNRLAAAEQEVVEAQRRHAEYLERGARAESAEEDLDCARVRLRALLSAQAERDARQAEARARRAEQLAARHPDGAPALAAREELADRVAEALSAWQRRPAPLPLAGPSSEELEAELRALPDVPTGDLAPHPDVVAALNRVELARQALDLDVAPTSEQGSDLPLDEAQLRELARRVRIPRPPAVAELEAELARARAETPRSRRGPVAAGAVASAMLVVAIVAATLLGQLALGAVLGVVGLLAAVAGLTMGRATRRAAARVLAAEAALAPYRRAADEARALAEGAAAEARAAGLPDDADALDDLADRALLARAEEARIEEWRRRRAGLEARVDDAETAARETLRGRGVEADGDLAAAMRGYQVACDRRASQAQAAARTGALRRELEARRLAEASAAQALRGLREAEDGLRAAAAAAGVDEGGDIGSVVARLRAWQSSRADAVAAAQAAVEEWQELSGLLGDRTVAELQDEAGRMRARARELRQDVAAGELDLADREADLDACVARQRDEVSAAEREWHRLRGGLETLAADLPDVAASEEALSAARVELARVTSLASVVDETLRLLRAAQERVHRDLAPILARTVQRWLPAVSGGAYTEVSVDPADLSIGVKEARTGTWRTAALLSEGTREQIYLLLRVAMAQHLVTTGESAPLLLDEVTAQSDGDRRLAVLEMLHQVSAERQVILFSHDSEVAGWASEHLRAPTDALIRLDSVTRPVGPRAAAPAADSTEELAAKASSQPMGRGRAPERAGTDLPEPVATVTGG